MTDPVMSQLEWLISNILHMTVGESASSGGKVAAEVFLLSLTNYPGVGRSRYAMFPASCELIGSTGTSYLLVPQLSLVTNDYWSWPLTLPGLRGGLSSTTDNKI